MEPADGLLGQPSHQAPQGPRILIVDDDPAIRDVVSRVLGDEGYRVLEAADGAGLASALNDQPPDLVLLDAMLEAEDGMDLLASLRRKTDIPVIMLTGKGQELDRVLGLKLGADDYVVKPFSAPELTARIGSVLRRTRPRATANRLDFGGLVIDTASREILVEDQAVETTAKEFDLLLFLASSPRQVFSRPQLLEHVWGSSADWQAEATVTEHIRRIRRKIENDPDDPRWVRTVRGVGYRFEP